MMQDLPGNEKRFIEKAIGVGRTLVNGEVLINKGEHAGALSESALGGAKRKRTGKRPGSV